MRLNEAVLVNKPPTNDDQLDESVKSMAIAAASLIVGAAGAVGGYYAGAAVAGSMVTNGVLGGTAAINATLTLISLGILPSAGVAIVFGSAVAGATILGSMAYSDLSSIGTSKSSTSKKLYKNINERDVMITRVSTEQKKQYPNNGVIDKSNKKIKSLTDEQKKLGGHLITLINKDYQSGSLSSDEFKAAMKLATAASSGLLTNIK